jgi:hypothetical protein
MCYFFVIYLYTILFESHPSLTPKGDYKNQHHCGVKADLSMLFIGKDCIQSGDIIHESLRQEQEDPVRQEKGTA